MNVQDGSLCLAESPKPGLVGAANPKRTIKILGFDGTKVHDFLFHVALSEIQWKDLDANPDTDISSLVQRRQALNRVDELYQQFLDACSKGPSQATGFLAQQRDLQKSYLEKSQAILQSLQKKSAAHVALLSEVVFGLQVVKSTATLAVAIIPLFLAAPVALLGTGVGVVFDVSMELINWIGPSNETHADAVVVGFKQTASNDAVNVAGDVQQAGFESSAAVLQKTLSYPLKSSTFRSAVANASKIDRLLKILGGVAAVATLYTEGSATYTSLQQMENARSSYEGLP